MALEGRVAVVTGATGIVGEGIARAFLEAGATVVAPIRSAGAKHLGTYVGVKFKDGVDHVVACTGGMVQMGLITQVTHEGFNQAMQDRVLGQIALAQALAPLLKPEPSSSYTVVTGRLGETCTMPDGALFSVCNAAVFGIVQALQAEYRGKPQRINELRIGAIVRRDSEAEHPSFPGKKAYPASMVGAKASEIAAGGQSDEIVRLYLD